MAGAAKATQLSPKRFSKSTFYNEFMHHDWRDFNSAPPFQRRSQPNYTMQQEPGSILLMVVERVALWAFVGPLPP